MEIIRSKSEGLATWTFTYNSELQELECCDDALVHFLKKENIHQKGFASLNISPESIRSFNVACDRCLDLKNNTPANFSATLTNSNEKNLRFNVTATRLKPINNTNPLRILFTGTVVLDSPKKSDVINYPQEIMEHNSDIQDFLYLTLHELNAPVRKLSMLLERFISKTKINLTDDNISYIARIESVLKQLNALLDSLSVLYEVSSETKVFEICDLNKILKEILFELDTILQSIDVKIYLSAFPNVTGNARQLKLLFQNIIYNAIVFKKENASLQIELTAKLLSSEEKIAYNLPFDKSFYQFKIEDNGTGYDQQNEKIIFQPFRKLLGNKFPGSGLGLTICSKIVQNHSGIIYSKSSDGARVIIILPEK
jgi:signal transduction histidine kinase